MSYSPLKPTKVFLSSPRAGLGPERDSVLELEATLNVKFNAMELFTARPDEPRHVCLSEVRQSNFMILLLGSEYGSIDEVEGISNTHLEYEEAKKHNIDVFVFIKTNAEGIWEPKDKNAAIRKKHQQFYNAVIKDRWVGRFVECNDLKDKIVKAVALNEDEIKRKVYDPFVSYEEYFHSLIKDESKLFSHATALVSRIRELSLIRSFIKSRKPIALISGFGGVGKSKILLEYASRHVRFKTRWPNLLFVRENFNLTHEKLSQIPSGNVILVIDDAHKYLYLRNLLSIYRNRDLAKRIKVILSTRPRGIERIKIDLNDTNIERDDVCMIAVDSLGEAGTKKIIKSILGPLAKTNLQLVNYLVRKTKDCTLAAIVASKLVKVKKIDPLSLRKQSDFQHAVFSKFAEEFIAELNDRKTRLLIQYLAALSPIRLSDDSLIANLSTILKVDKAEIHILIQQIEERGLLIKRGRLVKLVPDLFSDYILYQACIDKYGETGFPLEAFRKFGELYASNILLNVSELEWQEKQAGTRVELLRGVWKEIKKIFCVANNYERVSILDKIEKCAVYQPQDTLDLIQIALKHKAKAPKKHPLLREWSHEDVVSKLPPILRSISYSYKHLPICCNLLWQLSKRDNRDLNPHTDHPLRLLQDIASYELYKPFRYNRKCFDMTCMYLHERDAFKNRYTPIDILSKFLEKEIDHTRAQAGSFVMSSYAVNVKNVKKLRRDVINVLSGLIRRGAPLRVLSQSLTTLCEGLKYPYGLYGRSISPEEIAGWLEEQKYIVRILSRKSKELKLDIFNHLLNKHLKWYSIHGRDAAFKSQVDRLCHSVKETFIYRIYRAFDGHYVEYLEDAGERDYRIRREMVERDSDVLTRELMKQGRSQKRISNFMNKIIGELDRCETNPNPHVFLMKFADNYSTQAIKIAKLEVLNPGSKIMRFLSSLITPIRKKPELREELNQLVRFALSRKNTVVCWGIAHAYSWSGFFDDYSDEDHAIMKRLVRLKDPGIIRTVAHGIANLAEHDKDKAIDLVFAFDFSNVSHDVIDGIMGALGKGYGIPYDALSETQVKSLLNKLIKVDLFDRKDWHIEQFLSYVCQRHLDIAVEFLFQRYMFHLRSRMARSHRKYAPLPYLKFNSAYKGIAKSLKYELILHKIFSLLLRKNIDVFWLPKLIQALSDNYSPAFVSFIETKVAGATKKTLINIALIFSEAHDDFIFDNHEFVAGLLKKSNEISEECSQSVKSSLFSIAISGGSSRGFGETSQKIVNLMRRGNLVSQIYDEGHPAKSFFVEVVRYAEEHQADELARDEEMLLDD